MARQAKSHGHKEVLGLAGEYAVASELCRRGFYAQLTLGHHKKTDLLVETATGFLRVSVKAKDNPTGWRNVSGISNRGDRIIFVDFSQKKDEPPDFYILGLKDWRCVINTIYANHQKKERAAGIPKDQRCVRDPVTYTLSWPASRDGKGWKGCTITTKHLSAYKSRWPTMGRGVAGGVA